MTLQVRYFAAAKAAVGVAEETLDGASDLGELVGTVTARVPSAAGILRRCSFLVDGQTTTELSTSLLGASRVDVLPPFAGG